MKISKTSIANFSKSNFFIPSLVILLVIVGWFFLLTIDFIEEDDSDPVSWSQKEDYVIEETLEGIFVKNEKAGLSFKVPDGWEVEDTSSNQLLLLFLEKGSDYDPQEGFLKKGCKFQLGIEFNKEEFERISKLISSYQDNLDSRKELITISSHQSLKTIIFEDYNQGSISEIETPIGKMIYHFRFFSPTDEENKCSEKFNEFLNNISIK